tara:strand:- start:1254 stop:1451 length:198 start_codon:yes stop_codon:yes gene_type:complete
MTYPTIELFSKMVKNTKNLRQKEMRLSVEQAVDLLSEITQVMASSETKEPVIRIEETSYDAGGFK